MHRPALLVAVALLLVLAGGAMATPHDRPDEPDGNVTVLRGPGSLAGSLDSVSELRQARTNGTLGPSPWLVPGDTLVLRFENARLHRAVTRAEGPNATARFFAAVNATNSTLAVTQLDHGTERLAVEILLRRSGTTAVVGRGDTLALVVETDELAARVDDGSDPYRRLAPAEYGVAVTVPGEGTNTTLAGRFTLDKPELELVGDQPGLTVGEPLYAEPNATLGVRGRTTLLPDQPVTVRVLEGNETLEGVTVRTVPRPDSAATNLTAALSLSLPPDRTPVTLEAVSNGRTLYREAVVVGAPPVLRNVTAVHHTSGQYAGTVRVHATVRYPEGGFVAVETSEGHRTTYVPADATRTVTLAVDADRLDTNRELFVGAVWDADGDRTYDPWTPDGSQDPYWSTAAEGQVAAVVDVVRPSMASETPTVTTGTPLTATDPETGTRTRTPRSSTLTPTPSDATPRSASPTPTGQPGFGLAGALAACAAALALVRGRT